MAHSQHIFKAYQTPSSVVLVDVTFKHRIRIPREVGTWRTRLTGYYKRFSYYCNPSEWNEAPVPDAMGVILSNIPVTGEAKDVTIARWLQEQTWDQFDIA